MIRFSVGLEETGKLVDTFKRALDAMGAKDADALAVETK